MNINLQENQQLWFTSDTHYNHKNICSSTTEWTTQDHTRKFSSLDEMNMTLINGINNHVSTDDILIHLGDWSFGGFDSIKEFRDRINCKNIHLVLGNHDHHIDKDKKGIRSLFNSVHQYLQLTVTRITHPIFGGKIIDNFVCMHYPLASWNNMKDGVIHLHGHTHLSNNIRMNEGKHIDVGVDGNDFEPINMKDIIIMMDKQPITSLSLKQDHHSRKTQVKINPINSQYGC